MAARKGIDPTLEKAVAKLLRDTMADKDATLDAKCKVIDRALKVEQIKQKMLDDDYGSGFAED